MNNVTSINKQPYTVGEPDQEIIGILRQALIDAESGRTTGLAIAYVDKDLFVLTAGVANRNRFTLLGAVCDLQHKIREMCVD